MAYLDRNPPARRQFRHPRRATASGVIVVHTAESTPDYVAFDGGAEAVARYIEVRSTPGSYHELVDSDSHIQLVEWTDEAFHDGTGTNPHSMGLSVATRADTWPLAPQRWRDGAVEQAAQRAAAYARWMHATYGVTIPPRRITADQARRRVPGFVTHGELDPGRRYDPGAGFPWDQFLARYAQLVDAPSPITPPPPINEPEDPDVYHQISDDPAGQRRIFACSPTARTFTQLSGAEWQATAFYHQATLNQTSAADFMAYVHGMGLRNSAPGRAPRFYRITDDPPERKRKLAADAVAGWYENLTEPQWRARVTFLAAEAVDITGAEWDSLRDALGLRDATKAMLR